MSKDSEEWDDLSESFNKHIISKKELKQLEERKLIEESDIQLSKELFQDNTLIEKKRISQNLTKIEDLKVCKQKINELTSTKNKK
jgi:hypothetical protein